MITPCSSTTGRCFDDINNTLICVVAAFLGVMAGGDMDWRRWSQQVGEGAVHAMPATV